MIALMPAGCSPAILEAGSGLSAREGWEGGGLGRLAPGRLPAREGLGGDRLQGAIPSGSRGASRPPALASGCGSAPMWGGRCGGAPPRRGGS